MLYFCALFSFPRDSSGFSDHVLAYNCDQHIMFSQHVRTSYRPIHELFIKSCVKNKFLWKRSFRTTRYGTVCKNNPANHHHQQQQQQQWTKLPGLLLRGVQCCGTSGVISCHKVAVHVLPHVRWDGHFACDKAMYFDQNPVDLRRRKWRICVTYISAQSALSRSTRVHTEPSQAYFGLDRELRLWHSCHIRSVVYVWWSLLLFWWLWL